MTSLSFNQGNTLQFFPSSQFSHSLQHHPPLDPGTQPSYPQSIKYSDITATVVSYQKNPNDASDSVIYYAIEVSASYYHDIITASEKNLSDRVHRRELRTLSWQVLKRFSLFSKLASELDKCYAGLPLFPTVPKSTGDLFIRKRQLGLASYLERLMQYPAILHSPIIDDFLQLSSHVALHLDEHPVLECFIHNTSFALNSFFFDVDRLLIMAGRDTRLNARVDTFFGSNLLNRSNVLGNLSIWAFNPEHMDFYRVKHYNFPSGVSSLAVSPVTDDGITNIYVGFIDGSLQHYHYGGGAPRLVAETTNHHDQHRISALCYISRYHLLISGGYDGKMVVVSGDKVQFPLDVITIDEGTIDVIRYISDTNTLIVSTGKGMVLTYAILFNKTRGLTIRLLHGIVTYSDPVRAISQCCPPAPIPSLALPNTTHARPESLVWISSMRAGVPRIDLWDIHHPNPKCFPTHLSSPAQADKHSSDLVKLHQQHGPERPQQTSTGPPLPLTLPPRVSWVTSTITKNYFPLRVASIALTIRSEVRSLVFAKVPPVRVSVGHRRSPASTRRGTQHEEKSPNHQPQQLLEVPSNVLDVSQPYYYLFTGYDNGHVTISLYDYRTQQSLLLYTIKVAEYPIYCMQYVPEANHLLVSGGEGVILISIRPPIQWMLHRRSGG